MCRLACLALLCFASTLHAETPREILNSAARLSASGKHAQAAKEATRAIQADPTLAEAYYLRGREYFRASDVKASAADFDKYAELRPKIARQLWERGITLYYVGRFKDGARQFETYQTFDDNDVENAVWRFLCMARDVGIDKARQDILKIRNDRRVPMMQIYELYRGKLRPEDVLAKVEEGDPPAGALQARRFYAHLYLGLYFEVLGDAKRTRHHILEAEKNKITHYMGDVAVVHANRLRAKNKPQAGKQD